MATRKSPAFSIDDAVGDSIWIRAQVMDWRLAVWMAASLHPWGVEGASHTLAPPPSPCSHRLRSGAALPDDALGPVLAGRLRHRMLPARRCYFAASNLSPTSLVGFTIHPPLAPSLGRPIVPAIQT